VQYNLIIKVATTCTLSPTQVIDYRQVGIALYIDGRCTVDTLSPVATNWFGRHDYSDGR